MECLAEAITPDLIVCHLEIKRQTIEKILATAAKNGVDALLNPSPVAGSFRDTFTGNYVLEYVRPKQHDTWDIKKAVERGCKAAARTMEQLRSLFLGRTRLMYAHTLLASYR